MIGRATAVVCMLGVLSLAHADAGRRGMYGAEATVGVYSGIGGGVRVGDGRIGIHVIAAWLPLLVATQPEGSTLGQPDYDFHSTFQANADVYLLVSEPTPRSAIGVSAGYKGSTHLGHGIGLGFYGEIDNHKTVSYFLLAGVTYFPNGTDRLREKESYPATTEFVFPGPSLTTGVNLGIVISP